MELNQDLLSVIADKFAENLIMKSSTEHEEQQHEHVRDDDDFEFPLVREEINLTVSADELFLDGQIRPLFPLSDELRKETTSYKPPARKVFVVSENDVVLEEIQAKFPVTSPAMKEKSNSTGFSKLWKMKELKSRSNSDGKDTFVFLTGKATEKTKKERAKTTSSKILGKKEGMMAAYEALYGKKKEKKSGEKCYLPYRQHLVGFFTNLNHFTRNVHPY